MFNTKNIKPISIWSLTFCMSCSVTYSQNQAMDVLKENELKKLSLEKIEEIIECQRAVHNSFVIGSSLIAIVAVILIINYRKKTKISQLLNQQAEILHKQEIANLLHDQKLQEVKSTLAGQQAERKRIAMDLHDSLGGTLAGIKLRLSDNQNSTEKKAELEKLIDLACEEVRSISHDLMPVYLENSTFTNAIKNLIKEFNTTNTIAISLDFTSEEELNQLAEDIQVEVYRILQELVKNVLKHSKASKLEIDISHYNNQLTLLIEDNGVGFDTNHKAQGLGIKNIEARVKKLNGSFHVDSKIQRGTAVEIIMPVNNKSDHA